VTKPRAADDFATIRARLEELRRERETVHASESETKPDPPMRPNRNGYWSQQKISAGPGWLRSSGPRGD
jgi:hypothetical protein